MKIEKRRLDEIHPYAGNAKLHPAEQVEQIKKSIEQFVQPKHCFFLQKKSIMFMRSTFSKRTLPFGEGFLM